MQGSGTLRSGRASVTSIRSVASSAYRVRRRAKSRPRARPCRTALAANSATSRDAVGQMRNVEIQVLPLDSEDNGGLDGPFHLLRLRDGATVGHSDIQLVSRLTSDRRELQILELRYGIIRAQALRPRTSLSYIEKLLEET
ncbi:hypothetical protein SALBM217S_07389 [Streptomyces griseoloalbus]